MIRPRLIRLLLGGTSALALLAMVRGRSPRDDARVARELAPLAVADLVPGDGMGVARIGMSTLATFTEFFPVRMTLPFRLEETTGIELRYPRQGLRFLFAVTPECLDSIPDLGTLGAALRTDARALFRAQPACGRGTLEQITITYPSEPDTAAAFVRGRVRDTIGLGTPYLVVDSLLGAGDPMNSERVLTWDDLRLELRAQERSYRQGLRVAMAAARHGPSAGRIVVQRIDIIRPDTVRY